MHSLRTAFAPVEASGGLNLIRALAARGELMLACAEAARLEADLAAKIALLRAKPLTRH